jgi:hypothetical protein
VRRSFSDQDSERYGLFDLGRLEALFLKQVAGDFFALDAGEDGDA